MRQFEVELLRQLGYAINLNYEAESHDPLQEEHYYEYRFEQGPVRVSRSDGPLVFNGRQLIAIAEQRFDEPDVLRAANRLLREVVGFHLDGKELKSRKVLVDMRSSG